MKKINLRFLLLLPVILCLSNSCGQNVFKDMSSKDTNQAIFADALKLMNEQNYDAAIAKLLTLPTSYQENVDVREALAGAYAGQCGLNFLNLVSTLTSSTSTPLFLQLMTAYTSTTPVLSGCLAAETIMKNFGSAVDRTADQNFFLLIYGFAKIGLYLREKLDPNDDGVAEIDPCDSSGSGISDADIQQIFTGLGLILENFSAVTSQIANANSGSAITSISALCSSLLGSAAACAITDTSGITAGMIATMRDLLKSNSLGVGNCSSTGGAIATCC